MKLSNTITIMDIYGKNKYINCLSANPTKWSNTLKQFIGMCQHFVSTVDKKPKRRKCYKKGVETAIS